MLYMYYKNLQQVYMHNTKVLKIKIKYDIYI